MVIRRKKVSLIHLHSINYLLSSLLFKLIFKAPLIINFGGTDLLRLSNNRVLKFLAGYADHYLYVSSSMTKTLTTLFDAKKITYMGNGVDLDFFAYEPTRRKRQFIAVGNLRWQKGYHVLIEAFEKTLNKNPDFHLYIVGEGELRHEISEQIRNLKLQDKVTLLGTQSRASVAGLLRESFALVLSSVSEGFPKVLIESIASGTPIITTDVGACCEIAEGVGIVAKTNDANGLSIAMTRLIRNDGLWLSLSQGCENQRNLYAWTEVSARVSDAYLKLCKKDLAYWLDSRSG